MLVGQNAELLDHDGGSLGIGDEPHHEVHGGLLVGVRNGVVDGPAVLGAAVQTGLFLALNTAVVGDHGGIGNVGGDSRVLPGAVDKEGCLAGLELVLGIVAAGGEILRIGQAVVDAKVIQVLEVADVSAGEGGGALGPAAGVALFIEVLEVGISSMLWPAFSMRSGLTMMP